jgi:pSer/pThr/pTyr-binding forkhead associated (FHA) protein
MRVQLILKSGTKRWKAEMKGPEATLGRALGSTIRIPSSAVSRLHCRLRQEGGLLTVEDLESINGTFVNGTRISAVTVVRPGDRLTIGPVTFEAYYEPSPAAEYEVGAKDLATEDYHEPAPADEPESIHVLDESDLLDLPEGDQLRDLLQEMDDSTERPKKKRKK